jgi:NADPH2:quinone reductase
MIMGTLDEGGAVQAVLVSRAGGPEVLELREMPEQAPGPGELLVDVEAAGVNFIDVYQREGRYPMETPFVAGLEGAGTVRAVGDGVDGVAPGDRVAWAMVNGTGYTTQAVVPADRAVPVPDGVTTEQAAAVLLQGVTAQFLCTSTYPVRDGDAILVHAAAGGVGLLLTQMAARKGARVLATVSTDEKAALARAAGAAEVIRYDREDVVERVRGLTDGRGVAVVYDGVGRSTFEASLNSLARRGTLVLFGAASGAVPPLDPMRLAQGSLFLTRPSIADHTADRAELLDRASDVFAQVRDGSLDVRVGARYALSDAVQAHTDLEGRRTTGKSLIVPQPSAAGA